MFKIKIIEYGEAKEEVLAKIINQSYLTIATCSQFNYLVKKYFEISAAKSLILGNMPKQGGSVFGDNYIKLHKSMTSDEIYNIIKSALDDKDNIIRMTNINYNMVHKEHKISQFHERLYRMICEE